MNDKEIKALFIKADEHISIDEKKKQQTYEILLAEMEKQKIWVMSKKSILLNHLWYMDKMFFIVYGLLICFGVILIAALQRMGAGKNEMTAVCMISAGMFSMMSILMIDRLFFRGMAELGASCYFSTKQCIAVSLVLTGMINFTLLTFLCFYMGYHWRISLLRLGCYVLTPYFVSSVIALGILSMETGRRTAYAIGIYAVFLSAGYAVLASIPGALWSSSLEIWGTACVTAGILFAERIGKLFGQIEKGEVLCMN